MLNCTYHSNENTSLDYPWINVNIDAPEALPYLRSLKDVARQLAMDNFDVENYEEANIHFDFARDLADAIRALESGEEAE